MNTAIVGFIGLGFGLLVAPPQIIKLLKTKDSKGVSKLTYSFLVITILCYLIHAVGIGDLVFMLSNGINLFINSVALILIFKYDGIDRGKKVCYRCERRVWWWQEKWWYSMGDHQELGHYRCDKKKTNTCFPQNER